MSADLRIPRFRLSVNLYGAPSLTMKEFPAYQQDLIVGAALQVSAPWGQYDDTRLVNLGANRWFFKPSVGASKAVGAWILEATAAVTLYTDNTDFYRRQTRKQDPLYAAETHVIRSFSRGIWGSLDATYFTGGGTTIDDVAKRDLQRNWRVGATLALPINARNSVKLYAAAVLRRVLATISICSAWRGSTAGAAESDSQNPWAPRQPDQASSATITVPQIASSTLPTA